MRRRLLMINNNLENRIILYTATAKVAPNVTAVFGANIISNEWDSTTGKGVITFDADVTKIGAISFNGSSNITSITIPDSVTEIGTGAFYECSSLKSVTIGNSVTKIGVEAFIYCSSLKSVTIPDSVTTIGSNAFGSCRSLTSVNITDGVTSIGASAFANCTNLTTITIPDSVTTIGTYAFSNCSSLKEVYCKATTPPAASASNWNAFKDNHADRLIYVPAAAVDAYKAADGWSVYADKIEAHNF